MRWAGTRWGGTVAAVVGALALLGAPGLARAIVVGVQNLDRSDILDVWGYRYCDAKADCPYNMLDAVWAGEQRVYYSDTYEGDTYWGPYHTEVGIAGARGHVYTYDSLITADLFWFLYEPDKVTRNSSQVGMNQSDELGLLIYFHTSDSLDNDYIGSHYMTYAEVFHGCAGSVGVSHDGDDAKWKVQCKLRISQIADELGLPGEVQSRLENLLGKAWNKPLRIRGHGPRLVPVL